MTDLYARLDAYWAKLLDEAEGCGDPAPGDTSTASEEHPGQPSRPRISLADRVALGRAAGAWAQFRGTSEPPDPDKDVPEIVRLQRDIATGDRKARSRGNR